MKHSALQSGAVRAKFVVGFPEHSEVAKAPGGADVEDEIKSRPDEFLRVNVSERYGNLVIKTLRLLSWFAAEGKATFLLKLDDDSFPHIASLIHVLQAEKSQAVYGGFFFRCDPLRRGETALPLFTTHPPFATGAAYFLSKGAVQGLVAQHGRDEPQQLLRFVGEDVMMASWLLTLPMVDFRPVPATTFGSSADDVISINLKPGHLDCLWQQGVGGNRLAAKTCDARFGPSGAVHRSSTGVITVGRISEADHSKLKGTCRPVHMVFLQSVAAVRAVVGGIVGPVVGPAMS
ncbi:unnamed protein product [Polarella glacialis]|uniref:Hexosyltransferase n=1 Tax=Polarella glacialis TaxID=89957 RepID=A0A813GG11_POLGL|nr:unnamed protein product [Polarella glacialis]